MHSHDHDHGHGGHHHHHHSVTAADVVNKAFIIGIVLNSIYVVVQAAAGFIYDSVALLSDAGHNLSDVASLILSLLAFRLARMKPTAKFTYGYKKTTILAALTNAVVLFIAIGLLGYESVTRIFHPEPVKGGIIAVVAAVGIAVNMGSALLFLRHRAHDLNTRGAYLHLMVDAMVSLGVVVAGIVIKYTGCYWLDGAISVVILAVILVGTWSLLTHSLRMSLDAVPEGISIKDIEQLIVAVEGVDSVHHTHIWAMSTTENALTTHLVISEKLSFEEKMKVVHNVKHELQHNNIHHSTIEMESVAVPCDDADC